MTEYHAPVGRKNVNYVLEKDFFTKPILFYGILSIFSDIHSNFVDIE